jgi:hypothetical protein
MADRTLDTVPCYVLATDGLLYANPAISGHDWSVAFDCNEGVILEVSQDGMGGHVRRDPLRWARMLLRSHVGIAAELDPSRPVECGPRPMGKVWRFPLIVTAPLPAGLMRPGAGCVQPRGPCVVFAFGRGWG